MPAKKRAAVALASTAAKKLRPSAAKAGADGDAAAVALKAGAPLPLGVEPPGWLEMYKGIEHMRREGPRAPVDDMGCHMLGDKSDPKSYRYQTLIALMLSAQTKDQQTAAAMERLRKYGCTAEKIDKTTEAKLIKLIYGVGMHNNKAKYIKRTTALLLDEHDGDTPDNIKDLLQLPGVGPKMGYLFLSSAYGKVDGIGVDVHVHRLCNRYGWVDTKDAEKTRRALETWLPPAFWGAINKLLVGFGQTVCTPRNPSCDGCGVRSMCAYDKGGGWEAQLSREAEAKEAKKEGGVAKRRAGKTRDIEDLA